MLPVWKLQLQFHLTREGGKKIEIHHRQGFDFRSHQELHGVFRFAPFNIPYVNASSFLCTEPCVHSTGGRASITLLRYMALLQGKKNGKTWFEFWITPNTSGDRSREGYPRMMQEPDNYTYGRRRQMSTCKIGKCVCKTLKEFITSTVFTILEYRSISRSRSRITLSINRTASCNQRRTRKVLDGRALKS